MEARVGGDGDGNKDVLCKSNLHMSVTLISAATAAIASDLGKDAVACSRNLYRKSRAGFYASKSQLTMFIVTFVDEDLVVAAASGVHCVTSNVESLQPPVSAATQASTIRQ
jgi:hypothetical protein